MFFSRKPQHADFYNFFMNLSAYVQTGNSMSLALENLAAKCTNKILRENILIVRTAIDRDNEKIADAFSRSKVWPAFVAETIRAGEEYGKLDYIIEKIAMYIDQKGEVESSINYALLTPKFVGFFLCIAFVIMTFLVVPKYEALYASQRIPLPLFSVVTFGAMKAVNHYWYIFLGLLALGHYSWNRFCASFPEVVDGWMLKLPVYSSFYYNVLQYRFAQIMTLLWSAGVSPSEALRYTARAIDNKVYEKALLAAANNIMINACPVSVALQEVNGSNLLDGLIVSSISAGEETGKMDELLAKAEVFYLKVVRTNLRKFENKISVIVLVPAAAAIGVMWISIIMPNVGLFNMKF